MGRPPRPSRLDKGREECAGCFTALVTALGMPLHRNHELPRIYALQCFDHAIYGADCGNRELLPRKIDCLMMMRVHRKPELLVAALRRQMGKAHPWRYQDRMGLLDLPSRLMIDDGPGPGRACLRKVR